MNSKQDGQKKYGKAIFMEYLLRVNRNKHRRNAHKIKLKL